MQIINKKHIIIGICTFKRNNLLKQFLLSLNDIILPKSTNITLVLVNNYPKHHEYIEKLLNQFNFPFSVKFITEYQQGITFARNRILKEAYLLNATEIAMTDDDCQVPKEWLLNLYQVYIEYNATVVTGPVIYKLPDFVSSSIKTSFKLKRKKLPTGTKCRSSSTNNVLFDALFVKQSNVIFDNKLKFCGGSDRLFFNTLRKKGATIRWANNAYLYETVPKYRASFIWLLMRSFRCGGENTYRLQKNNILLGTIKVLFISIITFIGSLLILPFMLPFSIRILPFQAFMHSVGLFFSLFGYQYKEYLTEQYQNNQETQETDEELINNSTMCIINKKIP